MKKWQGEWVFMNVMHNLHRSHGTETVSAENEEKARAAIRDQGSKSLFGSTRMSTYIKASNVTELRRGR